MTMIFLYSYLFLTLSSKLQAVSAVILKEGRPVKIAIIPKTNSTFFMDAWNGCAREAQKQSNRRNIEVICDYVCPESNFEDSAATRQQIDILQGIISNETHDGVAISINDVSQLTPVVNRVIEAGIPLITYDSDAPDSRRLGCVSTNNTAFGDQLAKILLQLDPGGGVYGIVDSMLATNIAERVEGVRNRLRNTQWVESEVSPKDGKGNPFLSLELMGEMVLEDPSMNAIIPVALWPMSNISGWKEFVTGHTNITYIVGDSTQEQYRMLTQGFVDGLVGQMPFEMGSISLGKI
jgi:ribose transport system substrate-binding protein